MGNTPALRGGSKGRGYSPSLVQGQEGRVLVDYTASAARTLTVVKSQSNNSPTDETA